MLGILNKKAQKKTRFTVPAVAREPEEQFDTRVTRRYLLSFMATSGGLLVAGGAQAATSQLLCPPAIGPGFADGTGAPPLTGEDPPEDLADMSVIEGESEKRLVMVNAQTGETFDQVFVSGGSFVDSAIDAFSQFARDWRTGDVKRFNPKTIDIAYTAWKMVQTDQPLVLNSGYRSPETNRKVGGASRSQHLKAAALDLSHPTVSPRRIHAAAKKIRGGGVGRYNTFTHVDAGRVRFWSG